MVEIWKDGKWGTLCGHFWWDNQKGAENICAQLGYTGGSKYTAGGGTGPIHAGNRVCSGGETTVFDCPLRAGRTETTDCSHSIDQGVHCTDAVDGEWSQWGSFGVCDANGKKQRKRSCTNPAPINGGKPCSGSSKDEVSCPVDGQWSPWGSYGVCSSNGKKQRTRSCTKPAPLNGGKQCSGSSKDEVSCAGCPDGWKEFNQACYKYVDSAKTWEDAESMCQGQTWQGVQGHLASVHSEEENIFVASLAEETIWLCHHDLHQEGQWTWTDGTEFSYSNWAKGEPNNAGNSEDCMEIASPTSEEKQWNDDVCTKQAKFVCKLSRGFSNARASSILSTQYGPEKAIDGVISEGLGNFFHSGDEEYPWLELSMPEGFISGVEIVRRYDCCADRVRDLEFRAGMESVPNNFTGKLTLNKKVASFAGPADENIKAYRIYFEGRVRAKYVTIQKINTINTIDPALEINEVKQLEGFFSARSSSQLSSEFPPETSIDDKISHENSQFFHSLSESNPWLELSMPEGYISGVEIVTRYGCCADRVRDIEVRAGMDPVPNGFKGRLTINSKVATFVGPADDNLKTYRINFDRSVRAKYVTLQRIGVGTLE